MSIVKYGYLYGPRCLVPAPIGASEVFKFLGGAFVKTDGAGFLDIAGSGDTELIGWVDAGEFTAASTDGITELEVDISCDSVYRMPCDAIPALTDKWNTCDLIVASNIQKVDIGESTEDVIQIVGMFIGTTAALSYVDVRMNPSKMGTTGVV